MSLAAMPAYFLARRLMGQRLALLAALLAVAIPSMVYTGTLMTENAFYPLFLLAVLGLVPISSGRRCCTRLAAARACLVRVRDAAAGGRARAGDPRRAGAARRCSTAAGSRRCASTAGSTGSRRARAARALGEGARGQSPLACSASTRRPRATTTSVGAVATLAALARRRARPLRRDRCPFAALSSLVACRAAAAAPRSAYSWRRRSPLGGLAAARGRRVRDAAGRAAGRGAEHVLRRAAVPDRAARLDGPRRAAAACSPRARARSPRPRCRA